MMDFQLLTALLLLLLCPSLPTTAADTGLDVVGPSRPVCAIVGEDALFSCHLNPEMNAEDLEVAWSTNTGAALVHMYRHRKDYEDKPEEQFRGRTKMIRTDITRGAVGLVISNITRDDEAEYACGFDHETLPVHGVAEFDLKVAGKSACELEKDLDDLQKQRDTLQKDKDNLLKDKDVLQKHRDTLQKDKDNLLKDKDVLQKQRDTLQKDKDDLQNQRDVLQNHRDTLQKDKDALQKDKDDLIKERDTLLENRNIQKAKVLVTLDPDTAHPRLVLSEDRRRVRRTDTAQTLPDNPRRFTAAPCVLGSEGFTSGRHYWELQLLQEEKEWGVGVAAESVPRKGDITWSPEGGVWAVYRESNGQYRALTSPGTPLSPRERPQKLGVYLDYERGQLSLYNADSMEHLYTFTRASFTHRIFPFFCLWWGSDLSLV